MNKPDIIIIGAGLNGLNAALHAKKQGKTPLIIEQSGQIGGLAEYADINFGYPQNHAELSAHGEKHGEIVNVLDGDGRVLIVGEKVLDNFGKIHPESQNYMAQMAQYREFAKIWAQLMARPAPKLEENTMADFAFYAKTALRARMLGKSQLRLFMKIILSSIHDVMLDEIHDELLASLPMMWSVLGSRLSPRMAGSFWTFLIRHQQPIRLIEANSLINNWQKKLQKHDISVKYHSKINKIMVSNQEIQGVVLADGEEILCRHVISTIGAKATTDLIGGRHFDTEILRRAENFRTRANMAVAKAKITHAASTPGRIFSLTYGANGLDKAFDEFQFGAMPQKLPLVITIHGDEAMIKIPYVNEDCQFHELVQAVNDSLAIVARDSGLNCEITEIQTPKNIADKYNIAGGHWHHGDLTMDQSLMVRPFFDFANYKTTINGLYIGGAETHPGGDVHGMNGVHALHALINQGGK